VKQKEIVSTSMFKKGDNRDERMVKKEWTKNSTAFYLLS